MTLEVTEHKAEKVQQMSKNLLRQVVRGRRFVNDQQLRKFCGVCVSLNLTMLWRRFYTCSFYDSLSNGRRDARGLVRTTHQSMRDPRFWRKLAMDDSTRRSIRSPPPQASVHTDAADVGFGATLNFQDMCSGVRGMYVDQEVWTWKERASAITHRELGAVRLALSRSISKKLADSQITDAVVHNDSKAVVHILNAFVLASPAMMAELRRLKRVLDLLKIRTRWEWVPSAFNRFTHSLSQRLLSRDLQILPRLRRSIEAELQVPRDAFPFRRIGEPPHVNRKLILSELTLQCTKYEILILCPPHESIPAVLRKLDQSQALAMLLVPDWPKQPWHVAVIRNADTWKRCTMPA